MRSACRLRKLSVLIAAITFSAGTVQAQTTWTNVATGATWSTAGNWDTSAEPGIGTDVIFPSTIPTGGGTLTLAAGELANSLAFQNSYTFGPNTVATLAITSGNVSVASGSTATISNILAASGTAGLSVTGGGTLYLNRTTGNLFTGNITVDGAGTTLAYNGTNSSADPTVLGAAGARTITLTNGGAISLAGGTLSNPTGGSKSFVIGAGGGTINTASGQTLQLDDAGQFSGTGSLTKTGAGTLFLNSQSFTYTGAAVNIQEGTLRAQNAGSLGATNVPITVSSGATFSINATLSGTKPITVGGAGVGGNGALIATAAGVANGGVTLTSNTSIGGTANLTLSGVITDGASTFSVTKVGTNLAILSGTNTYDGQTIINEGVLRATSGTGLPTASNLLINGTTATGAVFEITTGFTRALGTGASQVQIPGGVSGFSVNATGAQTITLGGGAITWGSANFNPSKFLLQTSTANQALTFANALDLNGANRTVQVNTNTATLSGAITGTGAGLIKEGTGVLAITSSSNAYSGTTLVSAGVLRGASGTSLPTASNLTLNGGAFETTAASFTRALGTAAGEVQLTGGISGFSSQVANAVVNLGGAAATVTWGTATFNPTELMLNASSANNVLSFSNPLNLNGADRTINVGGNVATAAGVISTSTGTAGLIKTGTATLVLAANNTYNGTTLVSAGVLRGVSGTGLPTASNLTLNGGAFETTVASFTRALGTAAGEVQLTGGVSGFSSQVANAVVNLGGAAATVTWGTATFNPTELMLNASTANNTLSLSNPLDLNAATRTINVSGNVATAAGVISTSTGTAGLTKTGAGTLVLAANNTYNGGTLVSGGVLRGLLGTNIPSTSNVSLNGGQYESNVNISTGLGTGAGQFQLPGGTSGFNAFGSPITVDLGATAIQWGSATFNPTILALNAATATNTVNFTSPLDLNATAAVSRTVNVAATAANTEATISGVISNSGSFAGGLTKTGNGVLIISGANTYNGVTLVSAGALRGNVPATSNLTLNGGVYETGTSFTRAVGTAAGEVQLTGGTSGFSANGGAANVNLGGAGATIAWGGTTFNPTSLLLNAASANNTLDFQNPIDLNGGTGTAAVTRSFTINATAAFPATISGVISDSSTTAPTGITKAGAGTLILSGINTYDGTTTLSAGTLSIASDANIGGASTPMAFNGGTLQVTGTTLNNLGARTITIGSGATVGFDIANAGNVFAMTGVPALINVTGNTQRLLKAGPGTLQLNASGAVAQLFVDGGVLDLMDKTLIVNGGGGNTINARGTATINATGNGAIDLPAGGGAFGDNFANTGETLTINAKVTGVGGFEYYGGTTGTGWGTIILTNPANDYAAGTTINSGGTLSVAAIGMTGVASPLGTGGTIGFSNATTGAARLLYTGPGETTDRLLNFGNTNATVDASGTGLLKFTTNPTVGANAKVITLAGTGSGELAGVISNNSGTNTTAITKTGNGTWILSGANTYTAPTIVSAGVLVVNGSTAAGSAFTVQSGGTLSGIGTIGGSVTFNAGSDLAPGTSPGTLTTGALTLNALTELKYELDTPDVVGGGVNDLTSVTGNLSLAGELDIIALSGFGIGSYRLFNYTGTLIDNGLTLGDAPTGYSYAFNTANTGEVNLVVSAIPEPSTLVLGGLALLGFAGVGLRKRRMAKVQA